MHKQESVDVSIPASLRCHEKLDAKTQGCTRQAKCSAEHYFGVPDSAKARLSTRWLSDIGPNVPSWAPALSGGGESRGWVMVIRACCQNACE